jgi:hypothetical protein
LAHNFLTGGIVPTEGYVEWSGVQPIGDNWGMDGNDVWGDCGPAATDHYNMAKKGLRDILGSLGRPHFDGTLGTYWAYGLAQGEHGQPPDPKDKPDYGVDNATWLGFLYKLGIIKGYGEVEDNVFDWFVSNFHGGIVGQGLDGTTASNDFESTPRIPWSPMPQVDGHDTLVIVTHADGSGSMVTWGGVQPYTLPYREQNWQDRWTVFDKDDARVNWPALKEALDEIHGEVTDESIEAERESLEQRIIDALRDIEHDIEKEVESV